MPESQIRGSLSVWNFLSRYMVTNLQAAVASRIPEGTAPISQRAWFSAGNPISEAEQGDNAHTFLSFTAGSAEAHLKNSLVLNTSPP
jgi:hypothetical protein